KAEVARRNGSDFYALAVKVLRPTVGHLGGAGEQIEVSYLFPGDGDALEVHLGVWRHLTSLALCVLAGACELLLDPGVERLPRHTHVPSDSHSRNLAGLDERVGLRPSKGNQIGRRFDG